MSDSRFSSALSKINSLHNVNLSPEISARIGGTWSEVHFHQIDDVKIAYQRKNPPELLEQPLQVAISTFREAGDLYEVCVRNSRQELALEQGTEYVETPIPPPDHKTLNDYRYLLAAKKTEMCDGMYRLQHKQIPSRFNLAYLAFNSIGQKISLRGQCDLFTFIYDDYLQNKDHLHIEGIRRIVGHMLCAIWDLHTSDLVHRDIKLENFIMVKIDNNYFVTLADHNELLESNTQSNNIPATPGHMAPELQACNIQPYGLGRYNLLAKKALDCYALGVSIEQIVIKALYYLEKDEEDGLSREEIYSSIKSHHGMSGRQLIAMITGLMDPDKNKRFNIEQAMNNSFFGTDDEARKKFFKDLIDEENNYQLTIDGEKQSRHHQRLFNDYYLLLEMNIKCILRMGHTIDRRFRELNVTVLPKAEEIAEQEAALKFLDQELVYFIDHLNQIIEKKPDKTDFIELKEESLKKVERVKEKIEDLKVTKLLHVVSNTLAQFSFSWASYLFYNKAEISDYKMFEGNIKRLIKSHKDYAAILETCSNFLKQEPVGSIKAKLQINLTSTLGVNLQELSLELGSQVNTPQMVA